MKILSTYILLLFLVLLASCSDIFESDLEEENITIVAPSNGARNDEPQQVFLWEDLREDNEIDLEFYNLQIAKPSFEFADLLLLDTNVTIPTYTFSLEPGEYEWRVRGENANTKTDYVTYKLFIDSLFNLTNAQLVLTSPQNNAEYSVDNSSSGEDVILMWDPLPGADEYTVEVIYGTLDGGDPYTLVGPKKTEAPNLTQMTVNITGRIEINGEITGNGTYEWVVRAKNLKTNTSTSASRRFKVSVDTTDTN